MVISLHACSCIKLTQLNKCMQIYEDEIQEECLPPEVTLELYKFMKLLASLSANDKTVQPAHGLASQACKVIK